MTVPRQRDIPHLAACKVCGAESPRLSVVDFAKTCSYTPWEKQEPAGIPVMYFSCRDCGLIFTTFFDTWSNDDFARYVYNEGYIALDPDYVDSRPRSISGMVNATFPLRSLRILDYGGGSGATGRLLAESGYRDITVFEPFNVEFAKWPQGRFDLILCVEVMEHTVQPTQLAADLISLLADDGIVLLSTLLQEKTISLEKGEHWYIAPRNGHTHFHSPLSLERCFARQGCRVGHAGSNMHLVFRKIPPWAAKAFPPESQQNTPS